MLSSMLSNHLPPSFLDKLLLYSLIIFSSELANGFHWSLSDSKFPQVSRALLNIEADLNNTVVWTVSIRLVIFKSFSLCTNPFVTVIRALISISIIVNIIFHSLFQFSSKVKVLLPFFTFFLFYSVRWDSKVHNFASSLFYINY